METAQEKHLVIFSLKNEEYAVPISFVREIIKPTEIVNIPQSPDFVEGIIHLREDIIAVIDLAKRLKAADSEVPGKMKKIIIVEIQEKLIGLIVDFVGEVLRVSESQISPVPETISTIDTRYLQGVIKIESRVILLMDIEKVLSKEELKQLIDS